MKTVKLFEMKEEVMVKAIITDIKVEKGEIKYQLRDVVTGRDYGYLFTGDQLYLPRTDEGTPKPSQNKRTSKQKNS